MGLGQGNLLQRIFLALILCSFLARGSETHATTEELSTLEYVLYLLMAIFLCSLAGICSGLTVGYLSINKQSLILWLDLPDPDKVKRAKTILGILEHHHLLLSTLLLTNALCMEALPIFLDKLVPAYLAVFISTLSVLIVGEVIPQAYCTGANQIPIAYTMSSFVKFLEFIFAIFVKPIAWFLDTWLGHHDDKVILTKENIRTLLELHNSKEYGYRPEEIKILQQILDIRTIVVETVMTPISKVFMLDLDEALTPALVESLKKYNLSIIPVYSRQRDNIKGVIKVSSLLGSSPFDNKTIGELSKIEPGVFVSEGRTLLDVFDLFKSKYYMCFVLRSGGLGVQTYSELPKGREVGGIITLKQVFEIIVNKKFGDRDVHKFISGDFSNILAGQKKVHYEVEESREQD